MAQKRVTRAESKARTRAELLLAANRLFLRDGFVAASLAPIAEEAGLTKGAVYSNFDSKEDLFLELIEEADGSNRWFAHAAVDKTSGGTPRSRARAYETLAHTAERSAASRHS